jgi:hypothetical protein
MPIYCHNPECGKEIVQDGHHIKIFCNNHCSSRSRSIDQFLMPPGTTFKVVDIPEEYGADAEVGTVLDRDRMRMDLYHGYQFPGSIVRSKGGRYVVVGRLLHKQRLMKES